MGPFLRTVTYTVPTYRDLRRARERLLRRLPARFNGLPEMPIQAPTTRRILPCLPDRIIDF